MNKGIKDGFGTFKGVYLPSTLTILGVIMYLRMGWVVGHGGLLASLVIVTLSTSITFLTALSISATATNMKVEAGGAYFMISRSLGVEAGASIGLPLFVSQALGISFYIVGFSESLTGFLPGIDSMWISMAVLVFLTIVAYVSADLALKIQVGVFLVIVASMAAFFYGPLTPPVYDSPVYKGKEYGFWAIFAVFFPAVTGILTGVSMSGNLKKPEKSLPRGTLLAVFTGLIVYLSICVVLALRVPENELLSDPLVMVKASAFSFLIFAGLWGATLSSALGSLLGAPRTLQALGKDSIVPRFFAKGFGKDDNPRIATVATFLVAFLGILLGDLNAIAPVLSMFFLTAYGVLNLSAGFEELISNPSWRPKYRVPWWVSMLGAFGCFATMFMINAGATFIALFFTIFVYYFMQRRQLKAHWGDVRRGILMFLARYSIYSLAEMKPHAKSWRPNFLVLSGVPSSRWYLIEFADSITRNKGFLSVGVVLPMNEGTKKINKSQESIASFLKNRGVPALVEVSLADDVMEGLRGLVQSYGMGPLVPNTVVMGESEHSDNLESFSKLVKFIYRNNRNVVLMREGPQRVGKKRRIDVWWGRERQNAGLMLALGHMMSHHAPSDETELVLKSIVSSEAEKIAAKEHLGHFLLDGRLDVGLDVIVVDNWKNKLKETISQQSEGADLIFLGLRPPDDEESLVDYSHYYKGILSLTEGLPPTVLVMAAEDIDFAKIFE